MRIDARVHYQQIYPCEKSLRNSFSSFLHIFVVIGAKGTSSVVGIRWSVFLKVYTVFFYYLVRKKLKELKIFLFLIWTLSLEFYFLKWNNKLKHVICKKCTCLSALFDSTFDSISLQSFIKCIVFLNWACSTVQFEFRAKQCAHAQPAYSFGFAKLVGTASDFTDGILERHIGVPPIRVISCLLSNKMCRGPRF